MTQRLFLLIENSTVVRHLVLLTLTEHLELEQRNEIAVSSLLRDMFLLLYRSEATEDYLRLAGGY